MPEIKNTFVKGKMNKDLDERLIPSGEYRDAMNVQVSTSEGASVGTVQNILGNTSMESLIPYNCKCVGSIADEKNDKLYWFIKRDFTVFYKQTLLGPLWYLIQPLVNTLVFTIILIILFIIPFWPMNF